jgi:hypothetical protein
MAILSHKIDLGVIMIANIKTTVQITCKIASNLRLIDECN